MVSFIRVVAAIAGLFLSATAQAGNYDVILRGGTIYDGSGHPPYKGDVAIKDGHIAYVGKAATGKAQREIALAGKAVAPGFINVLSWATESLLVDPLAQSDIRQGVTLEVFGEGWSMGPATPEMRETAIKRQKDIKYSIPWTTLGEYLEHLQRRGIAPNVASFVGATTVRIHELGEHDVDPTPAQLQNMRVLVRQAMEEGALGVGSSLIYAPAIYAETAELIALAEEAGKCGGIYITHMRNESDKVLETIDEAIEIARTAGLPAEIYHLKMGGKSNWHKLDQAIARIETARRAGIRITANMYTYTAGATGLNAAMPPWVQDGGLEAWIERLKDPDIRARVVSEMKNIDGGWENLYGHAGPEKTFVIGFKTEKLRPLTGKSLAEVARLRGVSPEQAAIDLVLEDGTRVGTAYFLMSEENLHKQIRLPWMSFGSDGEGATIEGVFLTYNPHPRTYGNFARLLGKYVRDEKIISLNEAVRRLTSLPAANLGLRGRGALQVGHHADVVVFDPDLIQDYSTFSAPHQYAKGVELVFVNGQLVLEDGEPTGITPGQVVRGRAWKGWQGGGCRESSRDWNWAW